LHFLEQTQYKTQVQQPSARGKSQGAQKKAFYNKVL
jgi:hypothetical protein